MAGLAARLLGKANDLRVRGRGALAEIGGLYGGEGQHPATQAGMHRSVSRSLTNQLGSFLPPHIAANLADAVGLGNETLSGGLQGLLGNPVMSETGFDWADVASNRQGQDEALQGLEAHPSLGARLMGLAPGANVMEAIASRKLPR